ncbi:hypothetical protein ACFL6I_26450 [candidate division KSB1 bacterium]
MDWKRFFQPVKEHKVIYSVSILVLLGLSIFSGNAFSICKFVCPESYAVQKVLEIVVGFLALLIMYHVLLAIDLLRRYRKA